MKRNRVQQEITGEPKFEILTASHSHPALAWWWSRPTNLTNRFNGFVGLAKPLKRLMSEERPPTTTQLKQGVNESRRQTISWRIKRILIPLTMGLLTACQSASSSPPKPLSAGSLTEEYDRSSASVRSKYDGSEITVRGYTRIGATMPRPGQDQGSVSLEEKGREPGRQVTCWFSNEQALEFSKIIGGQYITVRGVFNGESGMDLKFCKLVGVE